MSGAQSFSSSQINTFWDLAPSSVYGGKPWRRLLCSFYVAGLMIFTDSISQTRVKLLHINNLLPFTPQCSPFWQIYGKIRSQTRHTSPVSLTCTSIDCPDSLVWNMTLITLYPDGNWVSGEILCPQMGLIFSLKGQAIGFCFYIWFNVIAQWAKTLNHLKSVKCILTKMQ